MYPLCHPFCPLSQLETDDRVQGTPIRFSLIPIGDGLTIIFFISLTPRPKKLKADVLAPIYHTARLRITDTEMEVAPQVQ